MHVGVRLQGGRWARSHLAVILRSIDAAHLLKDELCEHEGSLFSKKDTPCEKLSLPCASGANGSTKPLGDVSSRRFENAVGRPIVNSQLVGTKC